MKKLTCVLPVLLVATSLPIAGCAGPRSAMETAPPPRADAAVAQPSAHSETPVPPAARAVDASASPPATASLPPVPADMDARYKLSRLADDPTFFDVPGTRIAGSAGLTISLAATEREVGIGNGSVKFTRAVAPQPYLDPARPGYNMAGLTFPEACTLRIDEDGTLTVDRAGIAAKDAGGVSWDSCEAPLQGRRVFVLLPTKKTK